MGSNPTFGTILRSGRGKQVGAWLSLVERHVRDVEVGGSNPLAPTNISSGVRASRTGATRFLR